MKALYTEYKDASATVAEVATGIVAKYNFADKNIGMIDANEAFTAEIRTELKAIHADLADEFVALNTFVDEDIIALAKAVENFVKENEELFADDEQTEEDKKDDDLQLQTTFNKYSVSTNSVVYEKYDNGTAFVLNFNNYAIKVLVDGAYYTVDAYGYIVIS